MKDLQKISETRKVVLPMFEQLIDSLRKDNTNTEDAIAGMVERMEIMFEDFGDRMEKQNNELIKAITGLTKTK